MDKRELRDEWERGLEVVAVGDSGPAVFVALKDSLGSFYCHRYFRVDGDWHVSVDRIDVSAECALQWALELQNPF